MDDEPRVFTLAEARRLLAELRPTLDELVVVRADAAELSAALRENEPHRLGGIPELKAMEAQLDELLAKLRLTDVEVKGLAPVLLDFRSVRDGAEIELCWLEGEPELAWYHRADLGFLGRRPLD
ncbi:MAG: DUF2203 domain-containing protein [Frankia sp.]|nr:DUF2203 domain-containing protein [Frankia sp.]